MKPLRRIILWITLLGIAFLAVMSVVGAFIGDQRASVLFNSLPMAAFWVLLTLLLLAGLVFFDRLRRSFGLLATHGGCILILVGSLLGSNTGHRVLAALSGRAKIPSGRMIIHEGAAESDILAFGADTEIGRLPFSVRLNDFSIDYYPLEDAPWVLLAGGPPVEVDGRMTERPPLRIDWTPGAETAVPYSDARLTVLQYLPRSRPVFDKDAQPTLEISLPGREVKHLPAAVGAEIALDEPPVTLRIDKVFRNLRVEGSGSDRRVIDVPGPSTNPALMIAVTAADGTVSRRYVMPNFPEHRQEDALVQLTYLTGAEPVAAEADPQSDLPAMEILLKTDTAETRRWLIADAGAPYVSLSLADALGTPDHGAGAALYLARPRGQIRDYKSDLSVLEEGREVARKTIEVNDPLHYGGHHFYQLSYDQENEHYTVLSVRSDSGLPLVYAGFLLTALGVFWLFWIKPALAPKRRSDDGP